MASLVASFGRFVAREPVTDREITPAG